MGVDILNGHRVLGPLDGYRIAVANGLALIGKLKKVDKPDDLGKLSPVYEFKPQMIQTQGGVGITHTILPVLLLADIKELAIPAGAYVVDCGEIGSQKQKEIYEQIVAAEKQMRNMRATASGIVLPGMQ